MSAYAADGRGEVRARGGGAAPAARYTDSSMSRSVRGRSAQSESAASKSTFVVTSQALMAATRAPTATKGSASLRGARGPRPRFRRFFLQKGGVRKHRCKLCACGSVEVRFAL